MPSTLASITLFGATGFTGQLIAAVLEREGLNYRLAGRSAEKLTRLSNALPSQPDWVVADLAQPATLLGLFQNTQLLINCAGPFTDLGERVVAHAAMSGVHYLDITNELRFVIRARSYDEIARRAGAAIVTACAFEVALADCAASVLCSLPADQFHTPDSVDVVYHLAGIASQGTRRSAIRSLATSWMAYREGSWAGQIPGSKARHFNLPGGHQTALSFPSCESITIPQHLPVNRVDTWMATSTAGGIFGPLFVPALSRLSRSIMRSPLLWLASLGGLSAEQSPDLNLRSKSTFVVYVQASANGKIQWISLSGKDPYSLTAEIVAYAARQMIQPEFDRKGFLSPAQAFDPTAFLQHAQDAWAVQCLTGYGDSGSSHAQASV